MHLLSKAAFGGGMNNFVFIFYRQATATAFLLPLALFLEWKNAPRLSFVTFCKIFLLSLFGITLSLDIYGLALVYTSATLAAATTNCLPVITFFLAVLLGIEVLKLRTKPGVAKLIGIIICIAGAACLALYKGPHFRFHFSPFGHHHNVQQPHHLPTSKTWVKGCFLMLLSNFFWGLWLIFQAQIMKSYPSKLLFTALQCLLSSVQTFAIAIAMERRPSEWQLGWNVRLLAVTYCRRNRRRVERNGGEWRGKKVSGEERRRRERRRHWREAVVRWTEGIVVTGVTYYLQAWVIEKKGPVFLAMWTPLALIITICSSAILLDEVITLGRWDVVDLRALQRFVGKEQRTGENC
ncbi:Auxin-induced protein 5NG4 [Morus notabilis]|uniref:WAT1-related protein n=1 Tax=Morus notabilis TaxID=981085 RepID=W9QNR2_9ROSA|nr:Auxin-induced protein 5NG4 [Morus notabilis]